MSLLAIIDGRGVRPVFIGAGAAVAGALVAQAEAARAAAAASAASAYASADDAQNAADLAGAAALSLGRVYADTIAGLAATTNGQYFWTVNPANLYLNNAGAAVLQDELATLSRSLGTFTSPLIDDNTTAKAALESIGTNLAASGGAGNVGFLQSGTGMEAQTALAALRAIRTLENAGCAGNGTTDDRAKIQAALDAVSALGGGVLIAGHGKTYRVVITESVANKGLVIPDNVSFDLNGATLAFDCNGSVYCVRLKNMSKIYNGSVSVTASASAGSQAIWHCPISVGPAYGEGGTVGAVSSFEGVSGWEMRGLTLSSVCDGATAIAIVGGANNSIIDNITIPDSATLFGGVFMDWGYVGATISVADTNVAQTANKTAYNAGTLYTTHPNNIRVTNIKIGNMSRAVTGQDTGFIGIRLSSCYAITVDGVSIKQYTYAAALHTAGDPGFEFAQADVKRIGLNGSSFKNINVLNAIPGTAGPLAGWLVYSDSEGDNIRRAIANGYTSLSSPFWPCNLVVENVTGNGSGGPNVNDGIRFNSMNGGTIRNCNVSRFAQGIFVDAYSRDVTVEDNTSSYNRSHGIAVFDGSNPPDNIIVRRNKVFANGTDTTSAGIYIDASTRCKVYDNETGIKGQLDPTQRFGIWANGSVTGLEGWGNYHHSTRATDGIGEVLFGSSEFNKLRRWEVGVTDATYVATRYFGVTAIPQSYEVGPDGVERGVYIASRASLSADVNPSGGNWVAGERIYYVTPTAGGFAGCVCTTSGVGNSTAVFKTFGAVSA